MRFWTAYLFIALGLAAKAHASGPSGHHGSVTDLIAPAVNVLILVGFLVWKLKTPLHEMFVKQSDNIKNTLERASLKSQEAQMMLENETRKQSNLASELKSISQQTENDVVTFEKNLSKEVEDKTHKLKTDANAKIQAEKKSMVDDLNTQLLDQVIREAKATIKGNKDYQTKASEKLLQRLQ